MSENTNINDPVRLAPGTIGNDTPILMVGSDQGDTYLTTPLTAFGFKVQEAMPKDMKGVWRRMVVCDQNVVKLELCYSKKNSRFQLVAIGDFVGDYKATRWVHGVLWYSEDGQKWSEPKLVFKVPQSHARPHVVGLTVAVVLGNADDGGDSQCKPMLLPYDGNGYDTRYPDPGYCRFMNDFFADGSLLPKMGEDNKPDAGNHVVFEVQWPERKVGNGLFPMPAFNERFEVIRFFKDGVPRLLVKGPLVADMFGDKGTLFPAAIAKCTDLEKLKEDGLGSWEWRLLPPKPVKPKKQLEVISQITVDKIGEYIEQNLGNGDTEGTETIADRVEDEGDTVAPASEPTELAPSTAPTLVAAEA